MYKIAFYVPETHVEKVKTALFSKGAGKLGHYDSCCWQTLGEGQFRPLPNSQPTQGKHGELERVAEYKVEMVCSNECVDAVIAELKSVHPYEEPAFTAHKVNDLV